MEAKIEFDRASRRKVEKVMESFASRMGHSAEEAIGIIAFSAGRRLVNTVRPFGLKNGDLQMDNIGRQIDYVRYLANSGHIAHTSIESAHNSQRKYGKVRIRSQSSVGKYYKNTITESEAERYATKQKAKAGRAKAAWVTAVNAIGKSSMRGMPAWIGRHVGSSYGAAVKSGKGMKHTIRLQNKTPYFTERMQTETHQLNAAEEGLKNGLRRIQTIVRKEIEKANREMI